MCIKKCEDEKSPFILLPYIIMKRKLASLWLAWMLAVSPAVDAKSAQKVEDTKKDLVEAIAIEQTKNENSSDTISFEDAESLMEQKKLIEKIKQDWKIKDLIEEYWDEEVDMMIEEIVTSQEVKDIVEKALKDKDIKKALENWDKENLIKSLSEFLKLHHFNDTTAHFIAHFIRNVFVLTVSIMIRIKVFSRKK